MGTGLASGLFAVALLASGQSSTFTGTLAGQVVMEGFLQFRLRPWVRRLATRSVALLPALAVIALWGQAGTDSADPAVQVIDEKLLQLLVLSQVVLSFQLPFAIVPLIHFTSDRHAMGEFASRGWLKLLGWSCAVIVVGLNVVLIGMQMDKWAEAAGEQAAWVYAGVGSLGAALALFLTWVTVYPIWIRRAEAAAPLPGMAPQLPGIEYRRIGVAVEFAGDDEPVLAQAAALARTHHAALVAVHVVEGLGASYYGSEAQDLESRSDRSRMADLVEHLRHAGLRADGELGYGNPPEELVRIARERQFDLLVLGTHGHRFFADMALGRTVSPVLHQLTIPVLVVPSRPGTTLS
jgi:manganese transport protein